MSLLLQKANAHLYQRRGPKYADYTRQHPFAEVIINYVLTSMILKLHKNAITEKLKVYTKVKNNPC
jgi:hypothetical protein